MKKTELENREKILFLKRIVKRNDSILLRGRYKSILTRSMRLKALYWYVLKNY